MPTESQIAAARAKYQIDKIKVADFKPVYLPQDLLARETDRWVKIYRDLFM